MFEKLLKILSGDDIFISYSRRDGAGYAANLAKKLVDLRFSVYFDQWTTPPGKDLPASLRRKLRRCSVLVVLGTPGAARSDHVRQEIAEFNTTGRTVIPIIFDSVRASDLVSRDGALVPADETIADAIWAPLVQGLALQPETCANLINYEAPEGVIGRITDTCRFVRKTRRQLLTGAAVLAISTIVIVSAGVYASAKSREAVAAINEADRQTVLAGEARSSADAERSRADQLRKQAEDLSKEVADKTKLAKAATDRANEQTRIAALAETRATEATNRASEQTARARTNLAGNFFTQAQLERDPRRAIVWASKAVDEAPSRDLKRPIYSLATMQLAAKMPMALVNTPGTIQTAFFNETKDKAAVLETNGQLTLWDLNSGSRVKEKPLAFGITPSRVGRIAGELYADILLEFSRDGNWIAALVPEVTDKPVGPWPAHYHLLIWNALTAALQRDIRIPEQDFDRLAMNLSFSPTGNEVVVFGDLKSPVRVWATTTGLPLTFAAPAKFDAASVGTNANGYRVRFPLSQQPTRNWFLTIVRGAQGNDLLEIRNIKDGQLVNDDIPIQGRIGFADFSPDAKKVITTSLTDTAEEWRSWDIDSRQSTLIQSSPVTQREGKVISGGLSWSKLLDIGPDGTDFLMDMGDRLPLQVWHYRNGRIWIRDLQPDDESKLPSGLRDQRSRDPFFTADGRFVVESMIYRNDNRIKGGEIRVWDAVTGHLTSPYITLPSDANSSYVSPANAIAGVSLQDGSLMTWNLAAYHRLAESKQLLPNSDQKYQIYLRPGGDEILAISQKEKSQLAKIQLFDVRSGLAQWSHEASVFFGTIVSFGTFTPVVFSPDGERFLLSTSVTAGGSASVWKMYRTSDGEPLPGFKDISGEFSSLRFNRDGTMLISAIKEYWLGDPKIWTWNAVSGDEIPSKSLELSDMFYFLQFTDDGDHYIASSGADQRKLRIQSIDAHGRAPFEVQFSDYGTSLLGIALLKRAREIQVNTNFVRLMLPSGETMSIRKFPFEDKIFDDRCDCQLAVPSSVSPAGIFQSLPSFYESEGTIEDVSDDGRLIVLRLNQHTLRIYDTRSGQAVSDNLWHEVEPKVVKLISATQMLTIDESGQKHLWPIDQSGRQTADWIKGLGEALSGIRLVNQTTLQRIPQNDYPSVREKYIEKLQRAPQSDAAASAILKNLGLSSAP
jgi:WD40 repeat protein